MGKVDVRRVERQKPSRLVTAVAALGAFFAAEKLSHATIVQEVTDIIPRYSISQSYKGYITEGAIPVGDSSLVIAHLPYPGDPYKFIPIGGLRNYPEDTEIPTGYMLGFIDGDNTSTPNRDGLLLDERIVDAGGNIFVIKDTLGDGWGDITNGVWTLVEGDDIIYENPNYSMTQFNPSAQPPIQGILDVNIPEPATLGLFGLGGLALAGRGIFRPRKFVKSRVVDSKPYSKK